VVKLVRALMSLRGFNQAELALASQVSVTSLSRFFNEESELRAEALHRVLAVLGADVSSFVKKELTRALGADDEISIGEDIGNILKSADPIERRTIVDFMHARLKKDKSMETKSRLSRIKKFADSIETVRGNT
jgi:transcriptional regulator with XRE-family HTH domain